uniref:Uncharacterized protein n=1 Tax=Oryza meridionalis TaxID=40149 RepID=A0A0E0CG25_9ORYZ
MASPLRQLRSWRVSRGATSLCSTSAASMAAARTTNTLHRLLPLARAVHSSLPPSRYGDPRSPPQARRPSGEVELSKLEKTPSDRFDEIEAAIHANLVNDIEAYKSSLMADHGFFERMLTSMGIKKSYTRDQTLWLCKLILIFFASGSVGIGFAKIDDRLKQAPSNAL